MKRIVSFGLIGALLSAFTLAPVAQADHRPGHQTPPGQAKKRGITVDDVSGVLAGKDAPDASRPMGTFKGTLTITGLNLEDGKLKASGVLKGTATPSSGPNSGQATEVEEEFDNVPATLSTTSPTGAESNGIQTDEQFSLLQQAPACDILTLFLGPIDLNLLGLRVFLSPVLLLVEALPGPGNLLGNLLCAVAGLLDPTPTGQILGVVQQLLAIVNDILGGLLG